MTIEEVNKKTKQIHREQFWRKVRYSARKPVMRVLCIFRRHAKWNKESLLLAMMSGHSKRCKWCNRLVLKKQYRVGL